MTVRLLDVNVLVAIAWPQHTHHIAAHHGGTVVAFDEGLIRLAEQRGHIATVIPV